MPAQNNLQNGPYAAMSLAAIAYLSETDPPQQQSQMRGALSVLPPTASGPWTLVWGPANNAGNLVYVAVNAARTVYGVAIRGTVQDDVTGFFTNVLEDLDALSLVPWLYPQSASGAQIASGTNIALAQVIAMTDPQTDLGLLDFLRSVLPGSGAQIIVAGHSLGGALTSVVAPWLADQLPKAGGTGPVTVTPYTFAAPSAGNQAFVNLYTSLFPGSYRAVNTLDIVPMAWTELGTVQSMYPSPGQSLWDYSKTLYALVEAAKIGVASSYAQTNQSAGTDSFTGPTPESGGTYASEALRQHDHNLYLQHVTPPAAK